ncbi:MAG: tRNA pseudouridine(38-40) synthase TruA [Desulfobacterales bacterium]
MPKFKLTIEYDGTAYRGWQRQAEGPTIQAEIERAIAALTGRPATVVGAGRTDAGVHALGQTAHFLSATHLGPDVLRKGLNALLPADIAVRECLPAPETFHARYDARSKRYRYRILNGEVRSALERHRCWFLPRPLDLDRMRRAAAYLLGRHDFKSFESSGSPRAHTVRRVIAADWSVDDQGFWCFEIEADGFLRGMVRNVVGTLAAVGAGRFAPEDVPRILEARDRRRAGACAPAHGLFLLRVTY